MSEKLIAIKDYLKSRIQSVDTCFNKLVDPSIGMINVSGLSKKEKEKVVNQRNCLLIQKHCYNEILELLEVKQNEKLGRNDKVRK